ncbi:MAG TPA: hypothetical protein VEF04_09430, partial [Blastocatellia bacterium]|nr:hypothetical protein [Blastocatellia bacterium]
MNIEHRIKRLEEQTVRMPGAAPAPEDREAAFNQWCAVAETILATMPEEYAAHIINQLVTWQPGTAFDSLTKAFLNGVKEKLKGTWKPIAFPEEVCAVYLKHERTDSFHECEDCGFEIPCGQQEVSQALSNGASYRCLLPIQEI